MIVCRICKQDKTPSNFFKASKPGFLDKICKPCKTEAVQNHRHRFKQWAVEYKGGSCIRCGYKKCLAVLEFHHRDPLQKEYEIGRHNCMTKDRAKPELDKCDLLCRNCHTEIHEELKAGMVELVDALPSKRSGEIHGSSSLPSGTKYASVG